MNLIAGKEYCLLLSKNGPPRIKAKFFCKLPVTDSRDIPPNLDSKYVFEYRFHGVDEPIISTEATISELVKEVE